MYKTRSIESKELIEVEVEQKTTGDLRVYKYSADIINIEDSEGEVVQVEMQHLAELRQALADIFHNGKVED